MITRRSMSLGALFAALLGRTVAAAAKLRVPVPTEKEWPIYAQAGDIVTCENGHEVFTFARTIRYGEMQAPGDVARWVQPEPEFGTMIQPCTVCGADWYRGAHFHFEDGWR